MAQTVVTPSRIGDFVLRGTIGEGAFSVVKLVYNETRKQYYACKIIPKAQVIQKHLEKKFEAEIRINQQMHHPGIVQLIDILQDSMNYYIIMEFCSNGELLNYIISKGALTEDEAKPLFFQVLLALEYIHSMGVTHRDLKPENILIDQIGQLKISDFGLSRFMEQNFIASTPCGSPCYVSPECLSGNPYDGRATDMWSLGVILYAMLAGRLPWTKRNQHELFQQIKTSDFVIPPFLSENAQSLLKGMMEGNPSKRITISNALTHPWLVGISYTPISTTNQTKMISLRAVDIFFNRELSEIIERSQDKILQSTSSKSITFQKTEGQIHQISSFPKKQVTPSFTQKKFERFEKFEIPPKPDAKKAVGTNQKNVSTRSRGYTLPILSKKKIRPGYSGKIQPLVKPPSLFPPLVQ